MEQQIKEFDSLTELLEDLEREGIKGLQRRRTIEDFLLRKSRLNGRPYRASFELTPLCNFDCKMCYMHLTKEQMEKEGRILTTEEWLDIVRQAVDAGVTSVDLTGGECLTHPGFKDIYCYLVSRGVHVSVLTNAQLITDQHIELFTRYKPSVVQISLYGSSVATYIKVTGRNAYGDVMNNIRRLKEAGINLSLSVTPNKYMQDDVDDLLNLLHRQNVRYTIGETTLPARPETGRYIEDFIADNEVYIRISKRETEYRRRMAELHDLQPEKPYYFNLKDQNKIGGAPCAAGSANFHINWKGEMTPCIAFYTIKKSVFDDGLETAWQWIRNNMLGYRSPEECKNCNHQEMCMGCPAEKTYGVLNGQVNRWVCKRRDELMITNGLSESDA